MKLFSKKLQFHRLLLLTCVLLLVFALGASLARAENDKAAEIAVIDAEPESSPETETITADVAAESVPESEAVAADAESLSVPEPETEMTDAESELFPEPEDDMAAAELERLRLSRCVFTYYEGEFYWMSLTEEELAEFAAYFQEELNLNTAAVAGILTNIQFESGFDPTKVGDDGFAFGICQWRGARLDQMVAYCDENGLNPVSLEGQLAFLVHDLQENYIYPYDLVRMVSDSPDGASDATFYFCAYYEVPSDPDDVCSERFEYCDLLFYPALLELEED